ncbi:MAG: transcription antitermination factor NusB [Chromatiales bacterium]|nr:transcription antitermination factor NusB [Chromatiales bacterium]
MSRSRSRARACALQGLYEWALSANDIDSVEQNVLAQQLKPGAIDKQYFRTLLLDTINHVTELDTLAAPHLSRANAEIDPIERALLRLGACELKYHPEVPYRVVLNEMIELAKQYGAEDGHRFVNGVLDRIARELHGPERAAR